MKTASEFYYRIKENDTLKDICNRFNSDKENVIRNNPNIALYPGEWVKIKVNEYQTHHVKPMETLSDIARIYNIDIQTIRDTNNLIIDKLYIGQMLKIYTE